MEFALVLAIGFIVTITAVGVYYEVDYIEWLPLATLVVILFFLVGAGEI